MKYYEIEIDYNEEFDDEEVEEDDEEILDLNDDEEPEESKIELNGEIWLNFNSSHREILIKGKWKLTGFDEESDFEYNYFKEFDQPLTLRQVEKPVFAIEKDYSTLVKKGVETPAFNKTEYSIKHIAHLFGGVYKGWFNYNGEVMNEFSSMNFLPSENIEEQNKFTIAGIF